MRVLTMAEVKAHDADTKVPYAVRSYTRWQIGGDRNALHRYVDGPDALPAGKPRTHQPAAQGVRIVNDSDTELLRALELYRVRTQSHLYEDWHVDMTIDLAQAGARRDGHLLADCHRCHTTTPVSPDTGRCPHCGTEY